MSLFRKVVCQHNHWMGWCADCEKEVARAIAQLDATGTITSEVWRALNHWQRGAALGYRQSPEGKAVGNDGS